jgi:hypothetical protein
MYDWLLRKSFKLKKERSEKMDLHEEQKYERTIDQIMVQFENLIMDIILTSIKRLNKDYDQVFIKATNEKQANDMMF